MREMREIEGKGGEDKGGKTASREDGGRNREKEEEKEMGRRTGVENKRAERQAGNVDLRRSPRWKGGRAGQSLEGRGVRWASVYLGRVFMGVALAILSNEVIIIAW